MKIVTISPHADSDVNKGHWFWLHHSLQEFFNSSHLYSYSTLARKTNHQHALVGALRGKYTSSRFAASFGMSNFRDSRRIAKLLENSSSGELMLHVYEGGVSELLLLRLILPRIEQSNVRVIFNFHQASEWHRLFTDDSSAVKIFAKSLTRILLELQSKGVVFSGESEKLSKFIGDKIGTEVASYPIFSIYDPSPAVPGFLSAEREIDVLYCPSSVSELSICINSFNELLKNGTALRGRLIWRSGRSRKLFKEELDELSRLDIQVQSETLSRAEYIEIHENSKICVLPYLHDFYLWGSSGRVNDSILFNAVPIVPKNTALAERVGPNSPLVYDREDPISLATSVQKVLDYEPSRLELCPITMEDFKNWALNVTEDRRVQSHQEFSKSTLIATLLLLPALLSQIDFKERLLSALTHKIYQLKNGETIIKFFRKWLPGRV